MSRSVNKVILLGNLTKDPDLRQTPQQISICSFSLATNRNWTTEKGEKHEETEFHRIVAWNKLADLVGKSLQKGSKVYIEGRLSTRNFTGEDGKERTTTEIIAEDILFLDKMNMKGGEVREKT